MKIITMQVGPLGTNCYLLCDEEAKACAVVDPGGDGDVVAKVIADSGCTLTGVYLTHGHYDHTGGVAQLQEVYPDVPVYLNEKDAIDPALAAQWMMPQMGGNIHSYDEGDALTVGGLQVSVLATPGHTPGSVTLLCQDAMFAGDTLFAGSCGRTDFPGGDMDAMMQSLRRLAQLEGDYRVLPGHMGESTLTRERGSNPYLRHALSKG